MSDWKNTCVQPKIPNWIFLRLEFSEIDFDQDKKIKCNQRKMNFKLRLVKNIALNCLLEKDYKKGENSIDYSISHIIGWNLYLMK